MIAVIAFVAFLLSLAAVVLAFMNPRQRQEINIPSNARETLERHATCHCESKEEALRCKADGKCRVAVVNACKDEKDHESSDACDNCYTVSGARCSMPFVKHGSLHVTCHQGGCYTVDGKWEKCGSYRACKKF